MIDYEINKRFAEIRAWLELTQVAMAKRLKTTRSHICNIEAGRKGIGVTMLKRLHEEFSIDLNWFVMGAPSKKV